MSAKSILNGLIILVASVLCVLLFSRYIPFHMDEFACYQGLNAFLYPLNQLNIFRESVTGYHLAPFGDLYLPLRSNAYMGSVQGILYYPLFKLWPYPESARLIGLAMMALQAFLIGKLFRINILAAFFSLLFFMPYAFQHIVDTGPVSIQTTSIFFLAYLAQRWAVALGENNRASWQYPLMIGLIIFLCIWIKLTFFFILPSLVLLMVYQWMINGKGAIAGGRLPIMRRDLLILLISAVIPSIVLLNAAQRNGYKYYRVVSDCAFSNPCIPAIPDLAALLGHAGQIMKYFTDPLWAAHRVFIIDGQITIHGILFWIPILGMFLLGMQVLRYRKERIGFIALNLFLFFLTIFFLILNPFTWAMHHVVLAFPFMILAICHIYSRLRSSKMLLVLLALFMLFNFRAYSQLPRLAMVPGERLSKIKTNDILNERFQEKHAFVVIDFGMYYIKALYGHKTQCVLYIEPLNTPQQIYDLKRVLAKLNRKAVFVGLENSQSDLDLIKKEFSHLLTLQISSEKDDWKVWYEE